MASANKRNNNSDATLRSLHLTFTRRQTTERFRGAVESSAFTKRVVEPCCLDASGCYWLGANDREGLAKRSC
jgi:hypothetical protein